MKIISKKIKKVDGVIVSEYYYTNCRISDILSGDEKHYTEYVYDENDRLSRIIYLFEDKCYRVDKYEYSDKGDNILIRKHMIANREVDLIIMKYDDNGNIIYRESGNTIYRESPIKPRGNSKNRHRIERFTYDLDNKLKVMVLNNNHIFSYEYNDNGDLAKITSDLETRVYEYNEENHLVRWDKIISSTGGTIETHEYTLNDINQIIEYNRFIKGDTSKYEYTYDDYNNIRSITDLNSGSITEYEYVYK